LSNKINNRGYFDVDFFSRIMRENEIRDAMILMIGIPYQSILLIH